MSVSSEGLAAGLSHYRLVAKKRKVRLLPDRRPFEQVDIAQPQPIAPQRLAFLTRIRRMTCRFCTPVGQFLYSIQHLIES
jgi:hypothetical protein